MRYLDLLRHADAESGAPRGDATRELTDTGRAVASALQEDLQDLNPQPSYILCSSAIRTRQTMEIIRPFLPDATAVEMADSLYHASTGAIYELIKGLSDHHQAALLIGHNPGLSEIVNFLSATPLTLKPGDYVRLRLDADQWPSVMPGGAQMEMHLCGRDKI